MKPLTFHEYIVFRENFPEPTRADWSSMPARADHIEERGADREEVISYLEHIGKVLLGFYDQMAKFAERGPLPYPLSSLDPNDNDDDENFINKLQDLGEELTRLRIPVTPGIGMPKEYILKHSIFDWHELLRGIEHLLGDISRHDFPKWAGREVQPKHMQFIVTWIVRLRKFLLDMETPLRRLLVYAYSPDRTPPKWMNKPQMSRVKRAYKQL